MRLLTRVYSILGPGSVHNSTKATYACFHDWCVKEFWYDANYIPSDNRSRLLGGKELYCTQLRRLFDVALEGVSPGKGIYYGTLRCRTLPSKQNFPRQQPAPCFLQQIFLSWVQCHTFFPPRRRDQNSRLLLWNIICISSKFHHMSIMKTSIQSLWFCTKF